MGLSGKSGSVANVGGATQVREWSLALTLEPLEITNFDSNGWREFVEGLRGATGSFTGYGDRPTEGGVSSLTLNAGGAGTLQISGDAIINSVETSTPVDGVVEHSCEFTMNGEVTVGTVP